MYEIRLRDKLSEVCRSRFRSIAELAIPGQTAPGVHRAVAGHNDPRPNVPLLVGLCEVLHARGNGKTM